ncbi:MAG TPA: LysM peptidoglycan-binding domain-containing protein [Candidatus Limnocylindrales bacterium]|nr:LysM peptidoglycan-binding domain-containing protein [Candidatus Limnocylindrales bacterium]
MVSRKRSLKKSEKSPSVFDYLRFGESYTSLVLGIVVVIIGTVLLLSLVRNRNITRPQNTETKLSQNNTKISQTKEEIGIDKVDEKTKSTLVLTITPTSSTTQKIQVKKVESPTAKPTEVEKPTDKSTPKSVALKSISPTAVEQQAKPTENHTAKSQEIKQGDSYVAAAGDNLWSIADKAYKSGYNWVDIARANKLSNPNDVKIGQKLLLPKAEQKNASSEPEWTLKDTSSTSTSVQAEKIPAGDYTVEKGDSLWTIAVRAYGDGYKWVKIRDVNKISTPDIILPGAEINIPQK